MVDIWKEKRKEKSTCLVNHKRALRPFLPGCEIIVIMSRVCLMYLFVPLLHWDVSLGRERCPSTGTVVAMRHPMRHQ
jgi:hypothetical protein